VEGQEVHRVSVQPDDRLLVHVVGSEQGCGHVGS
jgi:hypothetical protein